jgi:uncharacterized phage protein (TIGR01671 family)
MNLREIKFRAWDNDEKRFLDDTDIVEISLDGSITFWEEGHKTYRDIELMQCTGLKDKNGKEIFEGDIVENRYENPLAGGEVVERYRIETAESSLIKMMHSSGLERYDRYLWMNYKNITVVGNIYDYPELMEGASL